MMTLMRLLEERGSFFLIGNQKTIINEKIRKSTQCSR